ncbi:MAG: hypothetical protein LIO90_00525, partial [Bacteroidales bacterium]|nr:hypothetical protein [Bacteroidales bacterium]
MGLEWVKNSADGRSGEPPNLRCRLTAIRLSLFPSYSLSLYPLSSDPLSLCPLTVHNTKSPG